MSDKDKTAEALDASSDLNELVFRDDLTKTYNRRFFYRFLKEEIPWGDPEADPVSLLMIDLDHFKRINDQYGHLEGDAALLHVADVFRSCVGERGHIVRYAGDEFSIVLPGMETDAAESLAETILTTLGERELRLESAKKELKLTLSIGVATFPSHGDEPKCFIEAADRALYVSKRAGRNRVSVVTDDAGIDFEIRLEEHFPIREMVGRDRELETARGILDASSWPKNTILLTRGAPGTGKSRYLGEVESEGGRRGLRVASHACDERDAEQPFGLLARILESFGTGIPVEHRSRGLEPDEVRALEFVVPDLFGAASAKAGDSGEEASGDGDDSEAADDSNEKADGDRGATDRAERAELQRKLVAAGGKLLARVASNGCLLLVLDDLHFADGRSLEVLGDILREYRIPLVLAGSVRERGRRGASLVREAMGVDPHREHSNLTWVDMRLGALSPTDLGRLVRGAFPGIRADRAIVHEVWDRTKGNPFYVEELLKVLLRSELLTLAEGEWRFGEIAWEDLPDSLEEAVVERIGTLDSETEDLLAHAAALGVKFRQEALEVVSRVGEGRMLEVLDRAIDAQIIRPVRGLDDSEFEFVTSTAKEVYEDRLDSARRQEIHGRVAAFEAEAHEEDLERVYGRLRYHYGRSDDTANADRFAGLIDEHGQRYSDRGEEAAVPAVRRARARIREADTPLTLREMQLMRNVLRYFSATLKNRVLYPAGSRIITESTRDLERSMRDVFETCRVFTLSNTDESILINGVKVDPRQFVTGNREFLTLLMDYDIQSITITRDVELREIEAFRDILHLRARDDRSNGDFWDEHLDEHEIRHISVDQRVYVVAGSETESGRDEPEADTRGEGKGESDPSAAGGSGSPRFDSEIENRLQGALAGSLDESADDELEDIIREIVRLLESGAPREARLGREIFEEFVRRLCDLKDDERAVRLAQSTLDQLDVQCTERSFGATARVLGGAAGECVKRGRYEMAARMVRYLGHHERRETESRPNAREARRALTELIRSPSFHLVLAEVASDDPKRRGEAREILLGFRDLVAEPLIQLIRETDDFGARKYASLVLNEIGEGAVRILRQELDRDIPEEELRRLLGVLDTFDEDFGDQLVAALRHESSTVRSEAVRLLKKLRGDIQQILLDVLRCGEGPVVTEAILQLGRLKAKEAVAPILEQIGRESVGDSVLYEGCLALGRIGDARAVETLVRILCAGRGLFRRSLHSSRVRFAAAWSLSQIDDDGAREALRKVRRDKDTEIRALAARSVR